MSRTFATLAAALLLSTVTAVTGVAVGQSPRLTNGQVTTQPGAGLSQAFGAAVNAQTGTGWIGYGVPMVAGDRSMCCFNSGNTFINGTVRMSDGQACCGMCSIEPSVDGTTMSRSQAAPQPGGAIKLEGPDTMVVLFRVVNRQVERIRVFSEDCMLDAGGRQIAWLTGVRPAESAALLESLIAAQPGIDRRDRVVDGAITAIALHGDAAADASLERLMATSQPQNVRTKVPFWLGNARGPRGLEVLRKIVKDDPSIEVKKKAVFGISQSPEAGSVEVLIDNARNNADTSVRGESIFWLAQKAGNKAAAAITERIDQDPDTEVKKKAVFALSQLPKDEGVPLLIRVARTHTNPAVRKQAMFWLGQSRDPRALDFFTEILK
jgi:HEAT repeat protein